MLCFGHQRCSKVYRYLVPRRLIGVNNPILNCVVATMNGNNVPSSCLTYGEGIFILTLSYVCAHDLQWRCMSTYAWVECELHWGCMLLLCLNYGEVYPHVGL